MNKLLILITLALFVGCSPKQKDTSTVVTSNPVEKPKNSEITLLNQYRISSGTLFIYKFGNDTIYLVEGRTSSYPVTMHVK
jgi:hypothetical protein